MSLAALQQDSKRSRHASTHRSALIFVVKRFGALYGAQIFIGSKGDRNILAMSTVSNFNRVLCEPCNPCYNITDSIFNPRNSLTYVKLNCRGNRYCSSLPEKKFNQEEKCQYTFRYPDGDAYVNDILSQDILRITRETQLNGFTFGCIHETNIGNHSQDIYGNLDLGRSPLSFVSQLGHVVFSYCLPPKIGKEGWLSFYHAAMDPGHGAVTIPLVDNNCNLYKVINDFISIIGVEYEAVIMTKPHGVDQATKLLGYEFVIDIGAPLSYIEHYWMKSILDVVKSNTPFPTIFHRRYHICFNISMSTPPSELLLPWMKLHFAERAKVLLNPSNLFVREDRYAVCLTFAMIRRIGREEGFILGSEVLKGHKLVIDRKENEVTFGPLLKKC